MKAKFFLLSALLLVTAMGLDVAAAARPLDVPMDRSLVTVLVRFGLKETRPATWSGRYRVSAGKIIATAGWRFAGTDYATLSEFQLQVRRFYPRFFRRRGRKADTLPIEPNGILRTL